MANHKKKATEADRLRAQGVPDEMQAEMKDASVEDSTDSIGERLHKTATRHNIGIIGAAAKKAKALAKKQAIERRIAALKKYREAKKKAAAEQEESTKEASPSKKVTFAKE